MSALFKILSEGGEACHGGSGKWPLPTAKRPGAWYEVKGKPSVCSKGLHLVSEPLSWWKPKARLFVAEPDLKAPASFDGSHKAAFSRARLLYEVTPDWSLLPMFPAVRVFLAMSARSRGDEETFKKLLRSADLRSADLRYANLSYADLRSANLSSADLSYADLSYADLSYANLRSADLSYANLSSADLRSANLRSANLSYADLRSANLSYAYRPSDVPVGWTANKSGFLVKA